MATWILDFKNAAKVAASLLPATRTSLATGTGVDLGGCNNQSFGIIVCGAITDGTFTVSIQESHNNAAADPIATDPYAALDPLPTDSLVAVASSVVVFRFWRTKRFARAILTVAGSPNTGAAGIGVLLGSQKVRF